MWKGMARAFQKCVTYGGGVVLIHSYRPSKSVQISINFSVDRRCQKKITLVQFWDLRSETNRSSAQWGCLQLLFVSEPNFQNWMSVIFFDTSYFRGQSSFSQLSQLWRDIAQSVKLTTPLCYTFSEPSGRQLSHGGTLDICCSSKISINLPKCEKLLFFAFFRVLLVKIFKWLPIGQYWHQ